jgi:hypothetical protein
VTQTRLIGLVEFAGTGTLPPTTLHVDSLIDVHNTCIVALSFYHRFATLLALSFFFPKNRVGSITMSGRYKGYDKYVCLHKRGY